MTKIFVQGALVSFVAGADAGTPPSVITFPFNPETITHTIATGQPAETFSFSMVLDSSAASAAVLAAPPGAAAPSAVQTQLNALTALAWPGAGQMARCPALFVWGAQRVVPVWVIALTTTETSFDRALNPIQATMQLALSVLSEAEIAALNGPIATMARMASDQRAAARQAALTQAQMPANADGSAPSLSSVLQFLL